MRRPKQPVHLLVYAPDDADAFARLIKAPARSVVLHVCHTPEEVAAAIDQAEVMYTRRSLAGARLRNVVDRRRGY